MKTIMKNLSITAILVLCVILGAKAQKTSDLRLGFGLNLGSATSVGYNVTLGGDLKLQKDFTDVVSGSLSTGYTHFLPDKNAGNTNSFGFVPLKAGIKFFPAKGVYFGGELGAGFGTSTGAGTGFLYAPAVGITFGKYYDFSARYEALNLNGATLGHIALRLAYAFSL